MTVELTEDEVRIILALLPKPLSHPYNATSEVDKFPSYRSASEGNLKVKTEALRIKLNNL